jgi:hypothetical protein
MLTHVELTKILRYDPETGFLFWNAPRPRVKVGRRAGYLHHRGYVYLEINGKHYAAHRLAWFYMTGTMPAKQIDHINRHRADNRFVNLREATHSENRANSKSCNKSGLKGIGYIPFLKNTAKCWKAQITHNKKVIYLGSFHTKEEAHIAYCDAAKRLHGDFFSP